MSIEVKFRRGTTSQHSTFTGAEGEVTVDTTKDTLVVHDGVTAGGIPLAKESAIPTSYISQIIAGTNVTISPTGGTGVVTINASGGGGGTGGAVDSVNGQTGTVVLDAADVGAIATGSLATVASTGDYSDLTGTPTLGSAAAASTTDFATALQGTKADSAIQPNTSVTLSALVLTGNLDVQGTFTTTNTDTLQVQDPIIYIGTGNTGNTNDLGFAGHFNNGTYQHTGLVRDATDSKWKLFSGVTTEPSTTINFASAVYDTLKIGTLETTSTQVTNWDTAYGWGNHASAGYLTTSVADSTYQPIGTYLDSSAIGSTVQAYDADLTSWAALAPSSKQDVLVSGTSIKTVNSNSLLGSGNVAVQDTLVSGTNIKTINGSSILGSGDLTVSSVAALAESTSVFTTGTAQTYTAPANTQWVKVTVQGGGANGGGTGTSNRASGGGAGGLSIKWLAMNAGQTLTYTVGGVAGASSVSSGTLTITTITANGGTAGTTTAYAASQTAGGAGGTATGGDINITGQQGGTSYGTSTTVATNYSGEGGNSQFGFGGQRTMITAAAGKNATGYGAGGGGSLGNATAGTGTGGIIIFEAY